MQCPKCKAEVSGKFCRQCGTAMPLPAKDAATLCPACGASVRAGARFCTKCAAPLTGSAGRVAVQAGVKCLHCGAELKPGAKFCKSCGKPTAAVEAGFHEAPTVIERPAAPEPPEPASIPASFFPASAPVSSPGSSAAPETPPLPAVTPIPAVAPQAEIETRPMPAMAPQYEIETHPKVDAASPAPLPATVFKPLSEVEVPAAPPLVERAPVSSAVPPASSAAPLRMPPTPAPPPQAEVQTRPTIGQPVPPPAARPLPKTLPRMEEPRAVQRVAASGAGSLGSNKAILFTSVAVLGLAFGGLVYWYVLRKPAVSSVPSQPAASQPATPAGDKPSPAQSATPAADQPVASQTTASQPATAEADKPAAQPQSTAPTQEAPATETKKTTNEPAGAASTTSSSAPARSAETPPSAPTDLTGNWQGEYTNTGLATKVSLQISKDSADLLTGTLIFDAGGSNSATCAITGAYNPQSKFMVLKVANCQGQPPAYLQGKIGFASVEVTATQMFGVDSAHNSFLNISRK